MLHKFQFLLSPQTRPIPTSSGREFARGQPHMVSIWLSLDFRRNSDESSSEVGGNLHKHPITYVLFLLPLNFRLNCLLGFPGY